MSVTDRLEFLKNLLSAPGPSGFEGRPARVWAEEAAGFASVETDHYGNTYATINKGAPFRVMLSGHIDEIGLMVTHVDDKGFVYFAPLGGWDAQVLVGQRVRLLASGGDLVGVVGKKPVHLMDSDERGKASKLEDLWLDFGFEPAEARAKVKVGDVGVVEAPFLDFGNGRVASKAIDNRIGAFAVLEALRSLAERGCSHEVTAVAAAQEEIGAFGARVAAYRLEPHLAIAVDVTFETRQPGVEARKVGEAPFGSGANLSVSALTSPVVLRGLLEAAERHGIPVTTGANPRRTGTDADEIVLTRAGVPSAVVSVPNRYMHSPSEMVQLSDVQAVVDLMAAYVADLPGAPAFAR